MHAVQYTRICLMFFSMAQVWEHMVMEQSMMTAIITAMMLLKLSV